MLALGAAPTLSLPLFPALTTGAAAQEFPTRPVRVIVGFPPGGGNDAIARVMSTKLTERLGKQFVVDNRAGASGMVASEIVAAAPPDGHTLMVVSIAHTANPALRKLKYDTEKSFTAVAKLASSATVLVTHPSVPVKTVKELIDHARKNPGKLHMAHAGVGTYQHMASSQFLTMAGIDVVFVPFKGGGPANIDVLAGHTQLVITSPSSVSGHIKTGKLVALGMTSTRRVPSYPDVPTIAEAGVPGYEAENWWGVVGPADIPKPILDKLVAEIAAVQDSAELQDVLAKEGARVDKLFGADFGRFISLEVAKWQKVVKDGKIDLQQ